MIVSWDDHYPDPKVLRKEVHCMCDSFTEVLLEFLPKDEIAGIYFKGSGQKEWESPLDYVPEISDVDIHLLFVDDASVEVCLGTTEQAIQIQSQVEKRYFDKVTKPLHIPRPQLMILNLLLHEENFISSPKSTISVLFGRDYPVGDHTDQERIAHIDRNHLLEEKEFISKFPLHIIDKPSKYLWQSLRNLVWHVSPVGSRVLTLRGVPYEKAWGANRTKIVAFLKDLGEHHLAHEYIQFYLNCWEYFLSHYADIDAGRNAIISAVRVLSNGVKIAREYKTST